MKKYIQTVLMLILAFASSSVFSQGKVPKYVSITFIKSKSADLLLSEKEFWTQVHQQSIKDGKESAWYLYHVKYPGGTTAAYDYVTFHVFTDWKQVEKHHTEFAESSRNKGEIVWEQL